MWNSFKNYLRSTFITGVFSAIPLVATIFVLWYVDKLTREPVKAVIGIDAPFVGFGVALVGIFVLGMLVRSLIGKYVLAGIDALLLKVPVLADIYKAWKQVTLTPGGSEGMYAKVVLVQLDGEAWHLGFTIPSIALRVAGLEVARLGAPLVAGVIGLEWGWQRR